MQSIIVVHALIAICLIGLVLLQHSKGTDANAAFGSGASSAMFGSTGATSFLVKVTIVLAAGFFITSVGLSYLASHHQTEANREIKIPSLPAKTSLRNFHPVTVIRGAHIH